MSDSDAEFERFLQESLSSSGGSHMSHSGSSQKFGVSSFSQQQDEATVSDQELEATGRSWLKSSNPLGLRHSLQITLPSIGESKYDYSKDSLESPNSDSYSRKKMKLVTAVDNVDSSAGSSMTIGQNNTQCPGLDTLEENVDKNRFFAELEKDRDTPINYSELNKGLSDTERTSTESSLLTSGNLERKLDKDDLESLSSHNDMSSGMSNDTITPMESSTNISHKGDNGEVQQQGFTLSPIHSSYIPTSYSASGQSHSRSDFQHSPLQPGGSPVKPQGTVTSSDSKLLATRVLDKSVDMEPGVSANVFPLKSQRSTGKDVPTTSPSRLSDRDVSLDPIPNNQITLSDMNHKNIRNNASVLRDDKIPSSTCLNHHSEVPTQKDQAENPILVQSGNNNFQFRTGKLSDTSPSVVHFEATSKSPELVMESPLVTDMVNSSLGGISNEMAELQSALIAAGLPQINSVTTITASQSAVVHSKTNLKDAIRAIASEELTTASKKMLKGDLKRDLSILSLTDIDDEITHKKKSGGMPGKIGHISEAQSQKEERLKRTSQLSNRREPSQGPRNERKQTGNGSKFSSGSKEKHVTSNRPSQIPKHLPRTNKSVRKIPRKPLIKAQSRQKQVLNISPKSSSISPERRRDSSPSSHITDINLPETLQAVDNEFLTVTEEPHAKVSNEVQLNLATLELEYTKRGEEMRLEHQREITELKQELFSLSIKLKDLEMTQNSRKLLASGKDSDMFISHEEKVALQKEIKEQELLLQGYQKENEHLYAELTSNQKDLKATQTCLYQENQQLARELASTKAQIEAQSHYKHLQSVSAPSQKPSELEATRIIQLEDQLEREHSNKKDLQNQVKQLKHFAHCLEQEIKSLKHKNKDLENAAWDSVSGKVLNQLKTSHLEEIADLMTKLDQYAIKHKVLEHTSELLKSKEVEITDLKDKIAALESLKSKSVSRYGPKSRATDTKRVHQLEKQVKELEKVIQKRFPNSLSALILAANSSTALEHESIERSASRVKELEECVKELRSTLETTENENLRKYEELQERYTELEMKYEQQAASINQQLLSHQRRSSDSSHSHSEEEMRRCPPHIPPTPQPHAGGEHAKSIAAENLGKGGQDGRATTKGADQLKEKLSEVHFELAHQRVQLQGKLAEAERKLSLANEEAQNKLTKLEEDHKAQIDSLIAKSFREHSLSEVTRLQSQLRAREATIVHLKEKIECLEYDADQLALSKAKEEKLIKQLKTTSENLLEARRNHTPEMHHFMILQSKIASLEERNRDFEEKNKLLWQNMMHSISDANTKEMEHKWRCQLLAKNDEIEQYREEIDSLLAALRMLQHRTA